MSAPLDTIQGMTDAIDYTAAGPLTGLDESSRLLDVVPHDPVSICRLVPGLILHPFDAQSLGLDAGRSAESQIRPADAIVRALLALDPASLTVPREPARRLIATCRSFVVLSCALLRYRRIAARARCGFGTYFQAGQGLDHWITEYWHEAECRWVRVDTQHLEQASVARPGDLQPGEFLTGGEAWAAHREGRVDAAQFGVPGTENFGPAEIRGNAIRDLAALNNVETLPWDEWGRMTSSYRGETGPDYDELLDEIAAVCAADDPQAIAAIYARDELRVPEELIR
jgi:hypothetical protein